MQSEDKKDFGQNNDHIMGQLAITFHFVQIFGLLQVKVYDPIGCRMSGDNEMLEIENCQSFHKLPDVIHRSGGQL